MPLRTTVLATVLLALLQLCTHALIKLQDVSAKAGLVHSMGPRTKYGGPSIADIDGDGYPDMFFIHHDSYFVELYFNKRDGTFSQQTLTWVDAHALSAFRHFPADKTMRFSLSRGGAYGSKPKPITIYGVATDRKISNISSTTGVLETTQGRGRSALYFPLRTRLDRGYTDVLVLNAANEQVTKEHQQGLEGYGGGRFVARKLKGFSKEPNWYGALTDFSGDGHMDLLSFQHLRVYSVTGYFKLTDVTDRVIPEELIPMRGVVAIVELDFDNDGLWDLYICRTRTGDLWWLPKNIHYDDVLLRNVGGRYVDVTKRAGIPQDGLSRGATVGDFDNDGLIDVIVVKFEGPSILLRNQGNGRFKVVNDIPERLVNAPGDMAQAVDYDRNGALDVVMSEGHTHDKKYGGYFRLFQNKLSKEARKNDFLLIRVGSSPLLTASSLHAVVIVKAGNITMMRRVGPAGVAVSPSYIELLHFGLGERELQRIDVRWLDGATYEKQLSKYDANKIMQVGVTS